MSVDQTYGSHDQSASMADFGSGALAASGLLASVVACGVPLIQGLASDWSTTRTIVYLLLTVGYLSLTAIHLACIPRLSWIHISGPVYFGLIAIIGCALQSLSGDPYVQPIIFTVPLVSATINYNARGAALLAVLYLALMGLGLWLGGQRPVYVILYPVLAYGALMFFMYVCTRLSIEQAQARQQADRLAADLERERDYLARLVEITATLTRDLDLQVVLTQVAATGSALAQAEQARVWLWESDAQESSNGTLRLAAVVPPSAASPQLTEWEEAALHVAEPTVVGTTIVMPLFFKRARIGVLELRNCAPAHLSTVDTKLLQPFADAAAVAIENARLFEQARLSATLVERNRLARELHDTIAQGLTAVTLQLEAAQRSLERDGERTRTRLSRAQELSRETLEQVRRSVWTLAAPLIDGQALTEELTTLVQRVTTRTGLQITYTHHGPPPTLSHTAATQLMRIVQEALHNVEKHADATRVDVRSELQAGTLTVEVRDDGVGFDPGAFVSGVQQAGGGFGLMSLRERARLAGGTLEVNSTPGTGTCVIVNVSNGAGSAIDNEKYEEANR